MPADALGDGFKFESKLAALSAESFDLRRWHSRFRLRAAALRDRPRPAALRPAPVDCAAARPTKPCRRSRRATLPAAARSRPGSRPLRPLPAGREQDRSARPPDRQQRIPESAGSTRAPLRARSAGGGPAPVPLRPKPNGPAIRRSVLRCVRRRAWARSISIAIWLMRSRFSRSSASIEYPRWVRSACSASSCCTSSVRCCISSASAVELRIEFGALLLDRGELAGQHHAQLGAHFFAQPGIALRLRGLPLQRIHLPRDFFENVVHAGQVQLGVFQARFGQPLLGLELRDARRLLRESRGGRSDGCSGSVRCVPARSAHRTPARGPCP